MRNLHAGFAGGSGTAGLERPPVRLASIVLLAGNVRTTALPARVGRSVLDLPVEDSVRLFDVWRLRIREFLVGAPGMHGSPDVRIVTGRGETRPIVDDDTDAPRFIVEQDASGFRGTAGLLRDLCERYDDDEYLLVGTASQCPGQGQIDQLVADLDPDVGAALSAGEHGSPTGLMLVRCGALQGIPAVGYIDLKEQALPRIAAHQGVQVVRTAGVVSQPIRDRASYVAALRSWHSLGNLGGAEGQDPFEEHWQPVFSLVEEGAHVGPGARLHDSVVLAGGTVGAGAVVVRSVVGPDGVVHRKQRVLERLVRPGEGRQKAEGAGSRRR